MRDKIMRSKIMTIIFVLLFIIGCVGTATKALNYQNQSAAKYIDSKSADPEVKQAAADIVANAEQIGLDIGEPATKTVYSPEASAEFRKMATENRELRDKLKDLVKSPLQAYAPWLLALITGAGGIYQKLRHTMESSKFKTVVVGGSEFAKSVPAIVNQLKNITWTDPKDLQNASALILGKFKEAHKLTAATAGVAKEIASDIHTMRAKGDIKKIDERTIDERELDPSDPTHAPSTT